MHWKLWTKQTPVLFCKYIHNEKLDLHEILCFSFKFHEDPCTYARARVVNARTRNKTCTCTICPKLGVFFKMLKMQLFCWSITQRVKKLQQWLLYEVIEDILPIVLNTKRPLGNILLLRYKQNSVGCFWKKSDLQFFQKTPGRKKVCRFISKEKTFLSDQGTDYPEIHLFP